MPASVEQWGLQGPSPPTMPYNIAISSTNYPIRPSPRITSIATDDHFDRWFVSPLPREATTECSPIASKAKKGHGSTSYLGMGMGMRTGIRHNLPPSSAGASFSSRLNFQTVSATDYHRCGMGVRIGIMHKLPPSSAGASFSSLPNIPDRERCRPCSTR